MEPIIKTNDKESLQQYADMAQVTFDSLVVMGYLSEMNAGNLETANDIHFAVHAKWMQAKFAERLKRLE